MSVDKRTIFIVCFFWIICFIYGYFFYPAPFFYVNAEKESNEKVQGIQTNTNAIDEIYKSVNSIDPTNLDFLDVETYATVSPTNLLQNASAYNGLKSCDPIDTLNINSVKDPYNILSILNKQNKIDTDFIPFDLVSLTDYNIPMFYGKVYLRKEVADKFAEMYQEMYRNGLKVKVSSGWRSLTLQQKVLNKWINKVGKNNANNYAALPGHSEHHLGTAVDILTPENGYSVQPNYFKTKTFKWLSENSYKYGFLLSYPEGKEQITGYNPEGWHYRYVGAETAKKVHEKGITLAEHLYDINGICY